MHLCMVTMHSCSSVPPAKNVHTSAAYFGPICIIDLWKENPLGLLRSTFLVSGS